MRIKRKLKSKVKEESVKQKLNLKPLDKILEKFDSYKDKEQALIPSLQAIQAVYNYLPKPALEKLAKTKNLSLSQIYGVATFYSQFNLRPQGKHVIKVCEGTACHVQGTKEVIEGIQDYLKLKDSDTTTDNKFTLQSVACLGCCSLAPAIMIDEKVYGKLTKDSVVKLIKNFE
jgi:NADH:ubiquinone oxidoreductase subunit E